MKSINTEGRVGGRVLLRREGWEMVVVINTTGVMELLLDRTHYFNCFFDCLFVCQNFSAGPRRFFIFLSCEKWFKKLSSPKNGPKNSPVHILPMQSSCDTY